MAPIKKRLRQREPDSDEESTNPAGEEGEETLSVADVLELRKLRKKGHGVDVFALGKGDPIALKDREEAEKLKKKKEKDDPWKLKTGGIVDLDQVKGSKMAFGEEPVIGGAFATASNTMDTEKKMLEFIERELKRKRNAGANVHSNESLESSAMPDDNDDEDESPEASKKPIVEGNVAFSAAMLTSIPVVDLGISTKLKNIEETEKAKRDIMTGKNAASVDKLTGGMNVSASDRFYRGRPNDSKAHPHDHSRTSNDSSEKRSGEPKFDRRTMATDDLVMEKFKKHNRPGRK
ncbi:hypothetical protein HDU98_008833 [Podochytrium sp. JEL0797]|nr:hypothetical protein HDU98_008833 [Podochytrium sp. JEL0797]